MEPKVNKIIQFETNPNNSERIRDKLSRESDGVEKHQSCDGTSMRLTAEAIEGLALTLEGVDDIQRGDRLALGVLRVCHGIADDVLKEDLEHAARLLVDEAGDTLDTATAGQTADGGLGDALNVVAQDLAMTLCSSLSKTLSSLATSRHVG